MSREENIAQAIRFAEEVFNQGNYGVIAEFYATPELAAHLQADAPALRQAFPDLHMVMEDVMADGDRVIQRWTNTGTNTGSFAGFPPTGKTARWGGVTITRFKDGKATEQWIYFDRSVVMRQLGLIPASVPTHPAYKEPASSH